MSAEDAKYARIEWLCRIYCGDREAMSEAAADENLFDRQNDFGLESYFETYRPLQKIHAAREQTEFKIAEIDHRDPDRTYVWLSLDDDIEFELMVRFETEPPYRVRYWMSYRPLPANLQIRPYSADDAEQCVALEQACPMEMLDGSKWTVDRGAFFDDYLRLMGEFDAAVIIAGERVVGFYSCSLRPIRFQDDNRYCVYQHHYRVHPDFRSGTVSQALASYVDPRRSFEHYAVEFPYSMIDPNNAHMQMVGFPQVEDMRISRISLAVETLLLDKPTQRLTPAGLEAAQICNLINQAHTGRGLFRPYTKDSLHERTQRVPSYGLQSFVGTKDAVLGLWRVNERNIMENEGVRQELRLVFVLDYGFTSVEALRDLVVACAQELRDGGATHLCFLCDQRSEEYAGLKRLSVDEQVLAVHTLPWTMNAFADTQVYCDAIYC